MTPDEALARVRGYFRRSDPALSGPGWSCARVLADEVERLRDALAAVGECEADYRCTPRRRCRVHGG